MTTDRVTYRHEAGTPLTVGALRQALGDVDDDVVVMAYVTDAPWSGRAVGYFAGDGIEVRPASRVSATGTLALHCGPGSGTLMRPRSGSLVVEHGAMPEDAAEGLRQTVHDAVSATGYRGSHSVASPGSVTTWQWESYGDITVAAVVAAAEAAAANADPGTWVLRSEVG